MSRDSAVLQLRLDEDLKNAFTEAAREQNSAPSEALRMLIAGYVRDARRSGEAAS